MLFRNFIYSFILSAVTFNIQAQIGGIAGPKINAINNAPIPIGVAEFEPNYFISTSNKFWDNTGKLIPSFGNTDSLAIETWIGFRMAYGASEVIELGTYIASDFSNWSVKYSLLSKEKLGLGLFGGLNLPYGITIVDKKNITSDQTISFVFGPAVSYQFSESFSADFNIQIQRYFSSGNDIPNQDLFIYLDIGKYIGDSDVQLLSSFGYQATSFNNDPSAGLFTFFPGIAFEMKANFFFVVNGSFDLSGKNSTKNSGIAMAWTITL